MTGNNLADLFSFGANLEFPRFFFCVLFAALFDYNSSSSPFVPPAPAPPPATCV